jgi:hypothetical protein
LLILIDPSKISPLLKSTASPALRVGKIEFNLFSVLHGVAGFCAWMLVRESSPILDEK